MNDADKATGLSGVLFMLGALFVIIASMPYVRFYIPNIGEIVLAFALMACLWTAAFRNPRTRHYFKAFNEWEKTYRYEREG